MHKYIRRALWAAAVPLTALGSVAIMAPTEGRVVAAAPCRDSNGAAKGGSVYVAEGVRLTCDVVPPQRLHVTRSNASSCADMGGRFAPATRICWDVDY